MAAWMSSSTRSAATSPDHQENLRRFDPEQTGTQIVLSWYVILRGILQLEQGSPILMCSAGKERTL